MKIFYHGQVVRCIKDFSKTTSKHNANKLPSLNEICIVKNVSFDEHHNFVHVVGAKSYGIKISTECFEAVTDGVGMKILREILENPSKEIEETAF